MVEVISGSTKLPLGETASQWVCVPQSGCIKAYYYAITFRPLPDEATCWINHRSYMLLPTLDSAILWFLLAYYRLAGVPLGICIAFHPGEGRHVLASIRTVF